MMNSIISPQIRLATIADAIALAQLGAQTFAETFAADNDSEDLSIYLESAFSLSQIKSELRDPNAAYFVAEVDSLAVGYTKLLTAEAPLSVTGAKPINLERLYVRKDCIGVGVGSHLIRTCIDHAQRMDYQCLWLGVWEHNLRAIAFYQKWGFEAVGKQSFQLGHDEQTDWIMQYCLPQN